jgi:hypothetical protein
MMEQFAQLLKAGKQRDSKILSSYNPRRTHDHYVLNLPITPHPSNISTISQQCQAESQAFKTMRENIPYSNHSRTDFLKNSYMLLTRYYFSSKDIDGK